MLRIQTLDKKITSQVVPVQIPLLVKNNMTKSSLSLPVNKRLHGFLSGLVYGEIIKIGLKLALVQSRLLFINGYNIYDVKLLLKIIWNAMRY